MGFMIDGLMRIEMLQIGIADIFIGRDQSHLVGNGSLDELAQRLRTRILYHLRYHVALASDCADHGDHSGVRRTTTAVFSSHACVPVLLLAADVGLVNLDFARQWKGISAHRSADSMAHKPSGLIAARTEHPMDLQGAHAFLGVKHQEDDLERIPQLDVRILEYGARQNAKPVAILGASQHFARALVYVLRSTLADVMEWARGQLERLAAATRALDNAIRPAFVLEESLAVMLGGEAIKQFAKGHLSCRHIHGNKYRHFLSWCQVSDNPLMGRGAGSSRLLRRRWGRFCTEREGRGSRGRLLKKAFSTRCQSGPPRRHKYRSILVLDLDPAVVVVNVGFIRCLVPGAFVGAVAKGFSFRKTAGADIDGQRGAFRNFVGGVLFVADHSGHDVPHFVGGCDLRTRRAPRLEAIKDQPRAIVKRPHRG